MKWLLRALGIAFLTLMFLYGFVALVIASAKVVEATYQVETREAHPDYVFVVRTTTCRFAQSDGGVREFNEVRFAEIDPHNPLVIELDPSWPDGPNGGVEGSQWRREVRVAIVPQTVAARYKTARECDEAGIAEEHEYFSWGRPVPPWYSKDAKLTVNHRIQPKQSGGRIGNRPNELVPVVAVGNRPARGGMLCRRVVCETLHLPSSRPCDRRSLSGWHFKW